MNFKAYFIILLFVLCFFLSFYVVKFTEKFPDLVDKFAKIHCNFDLPIVSETFPLALETIWKKACPNTWKGMVTEVYGNVSEIKDYLFYP